MSLLPEAPSRFWRRLVNDAAVRELAGLAGIATDWIDALDRPQRVAIGPLRTILKELADKARAA